MRAQTDAHEALSEYLKRIDQIDRIIAEPVYGLIALGYERWDRITERDEKRPDSKTPPDELYFPPWFAENGGPFIESGRRLWLTTAQCCGTLQRVWRQRRRFAWLARRLPDKDDKAIKRLEVLSKSFDHTFHPKDPTLDECLNLLDSPTYGTFNVFSAAQVFRVLVNEGEAAAHRAMGFLAFFRMIWSLQRRFPDPLSSGASAGSLPASAYLTAQCLLPIHRLTRTCWRRRRFFREIADLVLEVEHDRRVLQEGLNLNEGWQFSMQLEKLARLLHDLSEIAINRKGFREASDEILSIGKNSSLSPSDRWSRTKSALAKALQGLNGVIGTSGGGLSVVEEAEKMLDSIEGEIVGRLLRAKKLSEDSGDFVQVLEEFPKVFMSFKRELIESGNQALYIEDLALAAERSFDISKKCFERLKAAAELAGKVVSEVRAPEKASPTKGVEPLAVAPGRPPDILAVLNKFADANESVARLINDAVSLSARWCRSVVEREIAHISAGNRADFDPSELVSAIAVAVRWDEMTTPQQVSDAVGKAVLGAREDGSWSPGQPFYSRDFTLNAFVVTSEIVGLLAGSLNTYPEVNEADACFIQYLDWLERTRVELRVGSTRRCGWSSDRSRNRKRIDLWATALAIHALLNIRDLLEFRIWELCQARFTVIEPREQLEDMDPVDLGRSHERRLHHLLLKMARLSGGEAFEEANYSLVLHGPPGSSKTTVTDAIARESWTGSQRWGPRSRLVRITPADFTGGGEERIDSEARFIFDLLSHLRGVTILFDEIDDLLRKRPALRTEMRFLDLVVPAMLNRLADLREACPRQEICFLIATNFIEKIDPALIRKGRIDESHYVGYPDETCRKLMFERIVGKGAESSASGPRGKGDLTFKDEVVEKTAGWPWPTLNTLLKKLKPKDSGAETNPRAAFKRELPTLKRSFTEPDYSARLTHALDCVPLVDEYLSHLASLGSSREAAEKVKGEFSKLKEALERDEVRQREPREVTKILADLIRSFGGHTGRTWKDPAIVKLRKSLKL